MQRGDSLNAGAPTVSQEHGGEDVTDRVHYLSGETPATKGHVTLCATLRDPEDSPIQTSLLFVNFDSLLILSLNLDFFVIWNYLIIYIFILYSMLSLLTYTVYL